MDKGLCMRHCFRPNTRDLFAYYVIFQFLFNTGGNFRRLFKIYLFLLLIVIVVNVRLIGDLLVGKTIYL